MRTDDDNTGAATLAVDGARIQATSRAQPANDVVAEEDTGEVLWRWDQIIARWGSAFRLRVRTEGLEHVPLGGGALLVANHPSPGDAWILAGILPRRVLFVSEKDSAASRLIRAPRSCQTNSLRQDKFGIRPFEGYGCTECAFAVAVNTHDLRAVGVRQVGARMGSSGDPLPGVAVRIVDPVTENPVPAGRPGLRLLRGPNVMLGYLGRPDLTERVFRPGWYVTGDIAAMDDDGFLRITDRLSRFSKIGGEMVPHVRVEERLHELAAAPHMTSVVTTPPDERKGERVVVLHTLPDLSLRACMDRLAKDDLPNLWKPNPDAFFRIESFRQLGSGKLDLRRIKELARSLVA